MQKFKFKRKHLRAPLKSMALYNSDGHLLQARIVNISEGGVLFANLPHFPEQTEFYALLELISYPTFSRLSYDRIFQLNKEGFERNILKAKCRIVRTFQGVSSVDKLFINNIGIQFIELAGKEQALISDYVEVYKRNIIYFMNLFENSQSEIKLRLIRKLAYLFRYEENIPLNHLRSEIIHEYQSLESL
jgi:hypothetical protein